MPKPVTLIPALALRGAPIAAHSPMPPRIERPQILITEQADARPDRFNRRHIAPVLAYGDDHE